MQMVTWLISFFAPHPINALTITEAANREADWDDAPTVTEDFRQAWRSRFSGRIIVAGKFYTQRAEKILVEDYADMIAFGRFFVANPDLGASST